MARFDEVLLDLVKPMVEDKDSLEVRQMPSNNEKEIVLYVYAKNDDIARLIGRKGSMAAALRQRNLQMQMALSEDFQMDIRQKSILMVVPFLKGKDSCCLLLELQ